MNDHSRATRRDHPFQRWAGAPRGSTAHRPDYRVGRATGVGGRCCHDEQVAVRFPESTKISLRQRLVARARERWPQIRELHTRHHGVFTYVAAATETGPLPLCRLRYVGSAHDWQVAIYRASHDDYQKSIFPPGCPSAPAKTPSTWPAASTSTTPQPGRTSDPRRTNERDH